MSLFNCPMNREVFITAAVTGAGESTKKHPGVPVTPKQIADAAIASARAGAAIVHCHVREPETGAGSRKLEYYQEVYQRIREADVDAVINFTAGMGGDVGFSAGEDPKPYDPALTDLVGPMTRLEHIEALKPEICTLDCGSFNFGDGGDFIVMNTPNLLRKMAKKIQELGVKPECEVFDSGHMWFVNKIAQEGLLEKPVMVQLCMGIPFGAPADVTTAKAMVDNMPKDSVYSGFAISRDQMPFAALMPMLGGNVRVGLEDNLYLKRGVLATNEQLVEKARCIVENMGCRLLNPDEVRNKLKLIKHPYSGPDYTGRRTAKLIPQPTLESDNMFFGSLNENCMLPIKKAVCLGGGVIGAGWASRMALNGIQVTVSDPDPEAKRKVNEVYQLALQSFKKLIPGFENTEVGKRGMICGENIQIVNPITAGEDFVQAIREADFVQESLPEVPGLKKKAYAQIEQYLRSDVVIASSTSGILPADLGSDMKHPERLVIAHPFNPVYLLPLVEVVGGPKSDQKNVEFAGKVFKSIGMYPLMLGKKAGETPGFVSDRLLEALWREGLHLVNEGVATTSELDAAIAYGPGIRWSFMGTFMLYRLAGGEAGMRHFMKQFGPALKWPWTKLVAPELTDDLLDKIVEHSDNQAEEIKPSLPKEGRINPVTGEEISELRQIEKVRDNCLVQSMLGLKEQGFASGAVLKSYSEVVSEREKCLGNIKYTGKVFKTVQGSQVEMSKECSTVSGTASQASVGA